MTYIDSSFAKGEAKCSRGIVSYYAKIGLSKRSKRDAKLQSSKFFEQFLRDSSKHEIMFTSKAIYTIIHLLETQQNDAMVCRNCVSCILYLSRNSEFAGKLVNFYEVFPLLSKFVNHFDVLLQERCIRSIGWLGSHKSTVQRLVAEGLLLPLIQLLDRASNVRVKVAVLDCLGMLYLCHKICVRMMTIWFFPTFRRISDLMFQKTKRVSHRLRIIVQFGKLLHNFCKTEHLANVLLDEGGCVNFRNMCRMYDYPVGRNERFNSLRRKIRKSACRTFHQLTSYKNNEEINIHFLNPIISHKEIERLKQIEKEKKKAELANREKGLFSKSKTLKKKPGCSGPKRKFFKRRLVFKKRVKKTTTEESVEELSEEDKEKKLKGILLNRKRRQQQQQSFGTNKTVKVKKDISFLHFIVRDFFNYETIFEHRVIISKALNNYIINNQDNGRKGQLRKLLFMSATIKTFEIMLKCSNNTREFQKMVLEVFVQKLKRWKNLENFPKSLVKNLVTIWKRTYDSDLKLLSAESLAAFSNQGAFRHYLAENSNLSSIITHLKNKSIRNRIWAARVLSNLCSTSSSMHILNRLTSDEMNELTQICFSQLTDFSIRRFDPEYLMYVVKICAFLMCVNKGDSEKLTSYKHAIREKFLHNYDSINAMFSVFQYCFEASSHGGTIPKPNVNTSSGNKMMNSRKKKTLTSKRRKSAILSSHKRTGRIRRRRMSSDVNQLRTMKSTREDQQQGIYAAPRVDIPTSRNFVMNSTLEKLVILLLRVMKELVYFANRKGTGNYVLQQICSNQRRVNELLIFSVYRNNQKVCSISYEVLLEFLPHRSIPLPNFWKLVIEHTLYNMNAKCQPKFQLLMNLLTFIKSLVSQKDVRFSSVLLHKIENQIFDIYVEARSVSSTKLVSAKILVKLHGGKQYEGLFEKGEEFLIDLETFVRDFQQKKLRSHKGASRGRNKLRRVLFSQNVGGGLMNLSKRKGMDGSSGGGIVSELVKGKLSDVQKGREDRKKRDITNFLGNTKTQGKRSSMMGASSITLSSKRSVMNSSSKNRMSRSRLSRNEEDMKLLKEWKKEYGFFSPEDAHYGEEMYSPRTSAGFVLQNSKPSFFNREKLFTSRELSKSFATVKKYNFNDELKHFEKLDEELLKQAEFTIKEKNMVKDMLGINNRRRASASNSQKHNKSSSSLVKGKNEVGNSKKNLSRRKKRKRRRRNTSGSDISRISISSRQ